MGNKNGEFMDGNPLYHGLVWVVGEFGSDFKPHLLQTPKRNFVGRVMEAMEA